MRLYYTGKDKLLVFLLNEGGFLFDKETNEAVQKSTTNKQTQAEQQYKNQQDTTENRGTNTYNDSRTQGQNLWNSYGNLSMTGGLNADVIRNMAGLEGVVKDGQFSTVAGGGNPSGRADAGLTGATPLAASAGGGGNSGGGSGPNITPASVNRGQFSDAYPYSSNLASTGAVNMDRLLSTSGDFRNIADNPFDPTVAAGINTDIDRFRQMAMTGGLNDADKNNYLGNGVYKNFSETGGFSEGDANLYRQRATAAVPALYQNMADEMQRRRAVQGGYSPGFSNSSALLARQGSQQMNDAVRGAEADLQGQIRQNKLAGAQGLQTGQSQFSTLQTGNMLRGGEDASQTALAMEQAKNQNRLRALEGLTGVNQTAEQLQQQGKIAGAGFLTAQGQSLTNKEAAEINAGAAGSSASAAERIAMLNNASANQRAVLGAGQAGMIGGLEGQAGLFNTNVGQGLGYSGQGLSGLQSGTGLNLGYQNLLQQNAAAQPSGVDTYKDYLSAVGGTARMIGSAGMLA